MLSGLDLATGSPSVWFLCPSDLSHHCLSTPLFLGTIRWSKFTLYFPGPRIGCFFGELPHLPQLPPSPGLLKRGIEAKIWALDVLTVIGCGCSRLSQWNVHPCIHTHKWKHTTTPTVISLGIYIGNHDFTPIPSIPDQYHRIYSSFTSFQICKNIFSDNDKTGSCYS